MLETEQKGLGQRTRNEGLGVRCWQQGPATRVFPGSSLGQKNSYYQIGAVLSDVTCQ